jgi:hypothetical protein
LGGADGSDQEKYSAALSSALGPGFNVNAIGIGVGGGVASFALAAAGDVPAEPELDRLAEAALGDRPGVAVVQAEC